MELKKPEINEQPRDIKFLKHPVVPFAELWQTLQKQSEIRKNERHRLESRENEFAIKFSEQLHDLQRIVDREKLEKAIPELQKLIERIEAVMQTSRQALRAFGYEMEIMDGKKWQKISEAEAEMQGFIRSEDIKESIVSETVIPLIRWDGKMIQQAKVIVRGPLKTNHKQKEKGGDDE